MVNWLYKWYNPRGRWGAEEISSAFLPMAEDGLLCRQRREPAVSRRIARLRRDLHELAKALDAGDRFASHWCGGRQAMTLEIQSAVAATFAEHLNSTFRLHHEPATTELELIEVSDGSTRRQVSFSLLFRGPHQPMLPQQVYPFEHDPARPLRSLHRPRQAGRARAVLRGRLQSGDRDHALRE